MEDVENENAMVEVSSVVELSLNSVVGLTAPGTFKVKGTMEDREIIIMVDCGATHNFISLKLVDELKLPMTETTNYDIIMGSRKAVQGRGMCKDITVGQLRYGTGDAVAPKARCYDCRLESFNHDIHCRGH